MPRRPTLPTEIFKANTKKLPSGCLVWTGSKNSFGYGVFASSIMGRTSAHRASWRLHRGKIPKGMFVLHKCNNPPCVNPDHLRLGNQLDNMDDRKRAGHYPKGSGHFNATLNEDKVLRIYNDPRTDPSVAKDFGINRSTVYLIKAGKTWTHVTGGVPSRFRRTKTDPNESMAGNFTIIKPNGETLSVTNLNRWCMANRGNFYDNPDSQCDFVERIRSGLRGRYGYQGWRAVRN